MLKTEHEKIMKAVRARHFQAVLKLEGKLKEADKFADGRVAELEALITSLNAQLDKQDAIISNLVRGLEQNSINPGPYYTTEQPE